uniref:Uncharacterized protein n=1 Tax=Hippocampus comes TaxID=109280 RepID=A0A3Q3DKY9_HIPCM
MWKMSTSILPLRRLWALKHYQVENWGILRTGVSALCTTQKDEAIKSTEKRSATMVPAEPEDTFDNTLYRNYEHHSYSTYTFADMDVEMAKYRLPQPTSGRPSPRH